MSNKKAVITFYLLLFSQIVVLQGVFSIATLKACFAVIAVSLLILCSGQFYISFNRLGVLFICFTVGICSLSVAKLKVDYILLQWLYFCSLSIVLIPFIFNGVDRTYSFKKISYALCFAGLIASLLGFYEFFYFSSLGVSNSPLIPYLLPPKLSLRVGGFYGQPNLFSVFLLCCLIAYCYAYHHIFCFKTFLEKWFGWLPFVVVAVCFFMTGSMSGMIALLLYVCFYTYFFFKNSTRFNLHKNQYFKVMIMLCAAYFIYWSFGATANKVIGLSKAGISADARFTWWASALLMWKDNLWTGVGLGHYKFYVDEYMPHAHELLGFVEYEAMGYTNWAHNEFFQLLSEVGAVGLITLSVFLFVLIRSFRKERAVLPVEFYYSVFFMIPFCVVGMFSWPFRHSGLLALFLFFLSLLMAWFPSKTICLHKTWLRYFIKCFFIGLVISSSLVLCWEYSLIKFYNNEKDADQIDIASFQEMAGRHFSKYLLSLHLSPYYVQTILKNKSRQQAEQFAPYLEDLAKTQGAHWQWYNLGIIHRFLGNLTQAKSALNEAINRAPSNDIYWDVLHLINLEIGLLARNKTLEEYLAQETKQNNLKRIELPRPFSAMSGY